eukprot:1668382-Amphidinium_carterae.1
MLFTPIGVRGGPGDLAGRWRHTILHFADGANKEIWDEWKTLKDPQQYAGKVPWRGTTSFMT